jgi:hypothetical protein
MQTIVADARFGSTWPTYLHTPTFRPFAYAYTTGRRVRSADSRNLFAKHCPYGLTVSISSQVYVGITPLLRSTWSLRNFLGQSTQFVDTLLLQNPSLLDALLAKTNSSPHDFDEVSMLSFMQSHILTLCSTLGYVCSSCRGRSPRPCHCRLQRSLSSCESLRKQGRAQTCVHLSQCI